MYNLPQYKVNLLHSWRKKKCLHRATKLAICQKSRSFKDLSPREIQEIDRITTISQVQKGKVFYRPEETGEVLFILKKGKVQLYRISAEGKKLVITTLGPGTLFGEMALLGQQMHNAFAEATDDCHICVMSRTDLERLFLNKPMVALRVLEITGRRLREAEKRLEDMAFKGIPARLASLLLRVRVEHNSADINGLTHQDLAETVGPYRETATQVLNALTVQGLLEICRKHIVILDPRGCRPSPGLNRIQPPNPAGCSRTSRLTALSNNLSHPYPMLISTGVTALAARPVLL
ncbi:Crp/Fnr family transcriptional regulator [Candidatus Amarolinea dominans]|uniref:Crp/Fnr family transcriptional regulator n=1 Tax=Candidatus Amarolinea dominans TaxID=3140696 RepID=UPI0031CC7C08